MSRFYSVPGLKTLVPVQSKLIKYLRGSIIDVIPNACYAELIHLFILYFINSLLYVYVLFAFNTHLTHSSCAHGRYNLCK